MGGADPSSVDADAGQSVTGRVADEENRSISALRQQLHRGRERFRQGQGGETCRIAGRSPQAWLENALHEAVIPVLAGFAAPAANLEIPVTDGAAPRPIPDTRSEKPAE